MYLETHPFLDPTCETYCGPGLPYMYYDGHEFCVTDATEAGKWRYVDYSVGTHIADPAGIVTTVTSTC